MIDPSLQSVGGSNETPFSLYRVICPRSAALAVKDERLR
jgi:hypothetical protein